MARQRRPMGVIGWREWAQLPALCTDAIKAKVDTGARTSALHAFRLETSVRDGEPWVSFEIHPHQRSTEGAVRVETAVAGWRSVKSSNGEIQRRPVVRTPLSLGGRTWSIDITLTNRDDMGFRMLVGRAAIRRKFVVDVGRSYIGAQPQPTQDG